MPKRGQDDEEKPKKLSTYTLKLDDAQMEKLRSILSGRGWESFDVAYARYAFKGRDCNVTAYESGKLVVAGKGTEEFVTMTLEPDITMAPKLGYDEVHHPDWFELHAGLDESGKGDFFGPVVAATVIADRTAIEGWIKAGVKDSKKIAESQIIALDKLIRGTHGVAVATCLCGMPKYNLIMSRPYANLNKLLAWQHATALAQALTVKKAPGAPRPVHEAAARPARAEEDGRHGLRPADAHQGGGGPGGRRGVRRRARGVRPPDPGPLEGLRRPPAEGAGPLVKVQAREIIDGSGRARSATSPSSTSDRLRGRLRGRQARRTAAAGAEGQDGVGRLGAPASQMPKRRQLRSFDLKKIEGVESLIGVDEVGRGALAGPVVAGAVLVTRAFLEGRWAATKAGRVNDSKLLSAAERESLWGEFEALAAQGQIHAHYGSASVEEIELHNILGATKLAMRRAWRGSTRPRRSAGARSPTSSPRPRRGTHSSRSSRAACSSTAFPCGASRIPTPPS
jgi:ribonuclease HIII